MNLNTIISLRALISKANKGCGLTSSFCHPRELAYKIPTLEGDYMRSPAPRRSQKFRLVRHPIDGTLQIFSEVVLCFVSNPWRSSSGVLRIEKTVQNSRNAS
jgi:hypothetical protein